MKKITSFILTMVLISFTCFVNLFSQEVSTVVPPLSTFDDGLSMDKEGNIFASRYNGSTITKITKTGVTSIFASGISTPNGSDFGKDGYLYVPSNVANGKIVKISPSGVTETFIQSIPSPTTVLFREDGKMYICSYQHNIIYLADSTGSYSVLYTGNGMNGPVGMREDENGNLLIADYTDGKIFSVSPSGIFSVIAQIPGIIGFIEYANGYIYATGFSTNKIYKVTLNGQITVLAGTGSSGQNNGAALSATFNVPNGIIASPGGDSLFISDYGARSLRLISGVTTGVINISSIIPDEFELSQNYPNPFNPETKIVYQIPVKEKVLINVSNVNGKEIETLVNEIQNPGSYQISFNGVNYSSGIYYYTIQSGSFLKTMKMILIK